MKKIFFISFPASGHVNPSVNLCNELASRNMEVIYYTLEEYFHKFKGNRNIVVRKFSKEFNDYFCEKQKSSGEMIKNLITILDLIYTSTELLTDYIMREVEKDRPDLIICDAFSVYAKIAARINHIPLVILHPCLLQTVSVQTKPEIPKAFLVDLFHEIPTFLKMMKKVKGLNKKYNNNCDDPKNLMEHQNVYSIACTPKEFQPNGNLLPDTVKFMKTIHMEDNNIPKKENIIFLSLGTVQSSKDIWNLCIKAMKDMDYKIVITLGGNKQNQITLSEIPDNVTIYENMSLDDYRKTIDSSALFICHGGMNSVSEAILRLTPLLIIPGNIETYQTGQLIEKYKCGISYGKSKRNEKKLRDCINKVLNDEDMKDGLKKMREYFLNSWDSSKVVDDIIKKFQLFD